MVADPELRLTQELMLGIGGWRLLRPLASSRRSAISTRGTPPSPCWNAPALHA
jgi:glucan phosphorylase